MSMLVCNIAIHCCVTSHGYKANHVIIGIHFGHLPPSRFLVFSGGHTINLNGTDLLLISREWRN